MARPGAVFRPRAPGAWPAYVRHTALCPPKTGYIEDVARSLRVPSGEGRGYLVRPGSPHMVCQPPPVRAPTQWCGLRTCAAEPPRPGFARVAPLTSGPESGPGSEQNGPNSRAAGLTEPPAPSAVVTSRGLWAPDASWEL